METTLTPFRARNLVYVLAMCLYGLSTVTIAQVSTVTVRLANPSYDCFSGDYCLDVEFLSSVEDVELFGMNVRFFYDDDILELIGFSDFQGGYGPVSPDPPIIATNAMAGPTLFNFGGAADFVNGAIQLIDPLNAIALNTQVWTKVFQICFIIDDPGLDVGNFCPPIVWDLEQDPTLGGFLIGDDGVVITIVDPNPLVESAPTLENVVQFNWMYTGTGSPPYGEPVETVCTSLDCSPMIVCAADLTLSCSESIDTADTGIATATDICPGEPTILYNDITSAGNCPNEYLIMRTWIATNDCNLADTCVQMIMVIDTTTPMLTCPGDLTFSCASEVPLPDPSGVTTTDDCPGAVVVTHVGDVTTTPSCINRYVITRTYLATDACGNTASCTQLITVFDGTPPSIVCPDDTSVSVEGSTDPESTGYATGSDNCGGIPEFASADVTLDGSCEDSYIIRRTWTATDACGNTSTCLQTILVDGTCQIDLSLVKILNVGQGNLQPGDNVHFTITITNEGDLGIGEIQIIDYIPIGFSLNDPDWTPGMAGSTGQSASIALSIANGGLPAGGLLTGESISVEITLQIDNDIPPGVYSNAAEITAVFDTNGDDVTDSDLDSDPDMDDTNDPEVEDDHDTAIICLLEAPVILGDRFVCQNDIRTYTVGEYNPAYTYTFSLPIGGGVIIGTTPFSVTIHWDGPIGGPYLVSLTETASPECSITSTIPVSIEGGAPFACIDHINFSLDNECGTLVQSGIILVGEQSGNNLYEVFVILMNGDTVPGGLLTWEHVGQTVKVSVVSACTGQSCWAFLTVEDKLPPIIDCVCPASGEQEERCLINCLQIDQILNGEIPEEFRPTVVDNCGGTTLEILNIDLNYAACFDGFIEITWKATDNSGNVSFCVQRLDIVPLPGGDIIFPEHYVGECNESSDPSNTGWPQYNGLDITDQSTLCNLLLTYTDAELPLCGGGRKIVRRWRILDWCSGRILPSIQTIKLEDHTGPQLTCTNNLFVSTSIWNCYADVIVPRPLADDACSEIHHFTLFSSAGVIQQLGNLYSIQQIPIGTHTAMWTVTDECYNTSTCVFQITVSDNAPPIVSCDLHTVVSLTNDRPNGVTLVSADVFDNGSYDNCGPVTFRARRMDSCIDFDWTTNGACIDDTPGGIPPVNTYDLGTTFGTCVPFACCDRGRDGVMIELEVTDDAGNVNYCMVEVEVQDKLHPSLICLPEIQVSCEFQFDLQLGTFYDAQGNNDGTLDEDPLSAVFGNIYDALRHSENERKHIIINDPDNPLFIQPKDWGLEGWAMDNCGLDLSVEVRVIEDCSGTGFYGQVPTGAVKLIERRFIANDGVKSGSCLQKIWVVDYNRFFITDATCNNENPTDGVIWPCDILLTTCPDDLGDTGEPIIFDDGCSLIGVTHSDARYDFAEGACYKILRTWKVLDWCQFNASTGFGLWTYTQTIKVADSEGVDFLNAPSGPAVYCLDDPGISLPDNNQIFLGENNPESGSCSVHTDLGLRVYDGCSEALRYDVKIYLFNGPTYLQIVPTTVILLDDSHEAELRFNTGESSIEAIMENGLPYNSAECEDYHRIVWSVEDGCGNRSSADYLFRLEDCKKPTPVCYNGLSTVIMEQGGEVTIWASDFDASSFDDCTPGASLVFSFSGSSYQPSFTYTCDNVPVFGVPFEVDIWAGDGGADQNCNGQIEWSERNIDFCTTTIMITDNNNVCDQEGGLLEGEVMTDHIDAVSNVTIGLKNPNHTFPEFITSQDGKFSFAQIPMGAAYILSPGRNDDHRNGVSTLDLVRIQKHLLGQETFTSPYQYIAADANNSKSVSAIDLIEIRKLILGIQDKFAFNQSWRFVKKENGMPSGNPWPFIEQIEIDQLDTEAFTGLDFVGVKIGDVNNTVQANANQILPRAGQDVLNVRAKVLGKIEAGNEIEVELEFSEVVSGFQWTIETKGLRYVGISSEDILINDQHIGLPGEDIVTMSWNGDLINGRDISAGMKVKLVFNVLQPVRFIDMIELNGKVTPAEAYSDEGEILNVKLTFNSTGIFTDFALYQNKPNPWNNQTSIGFHLPIDAPATLTIYDVNGQIVKTISGNYKSGYNSVALNVQDIPSSGILYYRLESGAYTASKKMVVVK